MLGASLPKFSFSQQLYEVGRYSYCLIAEKTFSERLSNLSKTQQSQDLNSELFEFKAIYFV